MSTSPIKSRGRALRAFVRRHRRLLVFAAKMAAAYAAWFALYDLWLAPDGRLDAWLAEGTASLSTWLLSLGGFETFAAGRTFGLAGAPGLRVTDGCNGLSVLGLFAGFVLAYPGSAARRAGFIPLGVLAIYVVNVGRLVTLAVVQRHWPTAFDVMHDVAITSFLYLVVFGLWMAWAHVGGTPAAEREDAFEQGEPASHA
jgi:exosortase family protein XrtF